MSAFSLSEFKVVESSGLKLVELVELGLISFSTLLNLFSTYKTNAVLVQQVLAMK